MTVVQTWFYRDIFRACLQTLPSSDALPIATCPGSAVISRLITGCIDVPELRTGGVDMGHQRPPEAASKPLDV
ncbi:hypothetical protein CEP53_004988 [Fusarium sp. AF-6]|nr:hypothetical protein CEP53_004988 [Fusarium sp. AF-6]